LKEYEMTPLRTRALALASGGAIAVAGLLTGNAAAQARTPAPACGDSSLQVTHTPAEGAAGHSAFFLLFRNVTSHTCSLYGYPGLDALNASGHAIAHAHRTLGGFGGPTSITTVNVRPNHTATALVDWANFNTHTGGSCHSSAAIATTPANTGDTVRFKISVTVCGLEVHPTTGSAGEHAFVAAQTEWLAGASTTSADQPANWHAAAHDLRNSWTTAAHQLRRLAGLPDAMQTPAQQAEALHDTRQLNRFFVTPGLYLGYGG
jgi:hypothetical protein